MSLILERFKDAACEVIAHTLKGLSKLKLAPRPSWSNCIGDWTTCGYVCDHNGFFKFPLHAAAEDAEVSWKARNK